MSETWSSGVKNSSILIIVISSFPRTAAAPPSLHLHLSISLSLSVPCLTHTSAITFHTVGKTEVESEVAKREREKKTIRPAFQTHALIVTDSRNHFPVRSGDVPRCCCCYCGADRPGGLTPQCPGCSGACSIRLHAAPAQQFSWKNKCFS